MKTDFFVPIPPCPSSPPEAEALIEGLTTFTVSQIGSPRYLKQLVHLERLNVQAHHNALTRGDEYVKEALISFSKFDVLVHELLGVEIWSTQVLEEIPRRGGSPDDLLLYTLATHESTLATFLEVCYFHEDAIEATSSEYLIELVDYCHRQLIWLGAHGQEIAYDGSGDRFVAIRFACAMSCLTLLRYLSDRAGQLPISVLTRMVQEGDTLAVVIQCLENPPWVRKVKEKGGQKPSLYKYVDQKWTRIEWSDQNRITKTEAQAWLLVTNFCCDVEIARKTVWDDKRRGLILRLRKYVNQVLIDQIPSCVDLERFVEEMAVGAAGGGGGGEQRGGVVIEQVPEIRQGILSHVSRGCGKEFWDQVDLVFFQQILSEKAALYGTAEFFELVEEPKCAECGGDADHRCSRCKSEWYCSRECQVANWSIHKESCDVLSK